MKRIMTAALALLMVLALCGWTGPPNTKQVETPFRFHSEDVPNLSGMKDVPQIEGMQLYGYDKLYFYWDERYLLDFLSESYPILMWSDVPVGYLYEEPAPRPAVGQSKAQMYDQLLLQSLAPFTIVDEPEIVDFLVGGEPARIMLTVVDSQGVNMAMATCMFQDPKGKTLYQIGWMYPDDMADFEEVFVEYVSLLMNMGFLE